MFLAALATVVARSSQRHRRMAALPLLGLAEEILNLHHARPGDLHWSGLQNRSGTWMCSRDEHASACCDQGGAALPRPLVGKPRQDTRLCKLITGHRNFARHGLLQGEHF